MNRGNIYWADFGDPHGSAPAGRRPVVVVQADPYNHSRLATVLVVAVTSNTSLAQHPGNVFLPAAATGLPKDSVANVTTVSTLSKTDLDPEPSGTVSRLLMRGIDAGLRMVLALR